MWDDEFIKSVFEIAFGENAFERGYSQEEVLTRLRQFSDTALKSEEVSDILCDLHDIRSMAKQEGFGALPKDNDGTVFTIMDCIDNCVEHIEAKERTS
jgi:hypothetical protein